MKIGQVLKEYRLHAGLTQTEMAAGLVSESFYSKVERGVHEINAELLIKILEAHNFDVIAFFQRVIKPVNSYFDIESKIIIAKNTKNLAMLDKIKKDLKNGGGTALPYWLEFRLELAYAWITHSQDQVSPELKEKMKRIIVGDEWDRNAYYFLSQSMILMDFDDAASLVNSAYKAYDKNPQTDIFTLQWISFVGVNFLNYCYHHHAGEKYTESSIKFLKSLPITPDLGFSKVLALYYEALFNGDRKTQQSLIHLLKEIGYYSLIQDTVKEDV